jgi:hypothetical protein
VEVSDSGTGTPIVLSRTLLTTPGPTDPAIADPEITILLNWTSLAGTLTIGGGYTRSTVDIAAAVAEKLILPGFFPGLSTPLAELPFHLIGHSRGASLVGELAHDLGLRGIWVDQVTTLDPHPVDRVREPLLANYDFGDADMTSWSNVALWDNYWRTEGSLSLDFTGEPVAQAHDVQLVESILAGGYSFDHSDVHAWYHGTVDTSTNPPANNGDFDIPNQWYGSPHPDRDTSGYDFSRIVGGSRPADGLAAALGGAALRTTVTPTSPAWPNLFQLEITDGDLDNTVGDSLSASLYHQDADSGATISFYLDPDRNPYDANEVQIDTVTVADIAATPALLNVSLPTAGAAQGNYYLAARISDADGHARYAYAVDMITLAASPVVTVEGTSEGDSIVVTPGTPGGAWHVVDVNSTILTFDPAVVNEIHINGLGGSDSITIHGSDQNETVTIRPGSVDAAGQTYAVYATSVETVNVDAGGGSDRADFIGSPGSNRLYSYADYARLSDSPRTFSNRADGFDIVNVDAPGTGRDYAFLYDSPQNDELEASPDQIVFRRAVATTDATTTTATGFQRAYAYGTGGGTDEATLTGSDIAGNRFYGYADYSILTESRRNFYFYARDFDTATAISPGTGSSYAYLYDSSGTDTLTASPESAVMDRAAPWSYTTASGFTRVYAYSTRGGGDTAALTGSSSGGNRYHSYPAYGTLTDTTRSFYHYARGFRSVTATGSQTDTSTDRAYLYDSPGNDTLLGRFDSAILKDTAEKVFRNEALYFDLVYARSTDSDSNTVDSVDIENLAYDLIRTGTW